MNTERLPAATIAGVVTTGDDDAADWWPYALVYACTSGHVLASLEHITAGTVQWHRESWVALVDAIHHGIDPGANRMVARGRTLDGSPVSIYFSPNSDSDPCTFCLSEHARTL